MRHYTTVLYSILLSDEELSAEPRQLQPYMYEPLAADSAASGDFMTASDPGEINVLTTDRTTTHRHNYVEIGS